MKILVALLILLLASATATADDRSYRFGIMPTISIFNVEDPNGPTESANAFSYANLVMMADMGRDGRIMANMSYDRFSLSATQTSIGQDVSRMGGSVSYQTLWRVGRDFKPWIGLGLGAASDSYKGRYTLSPGGFSIAANPTDRSLNEIFLVANASADWPMSKSLDMGIHLQLEQPAGDGTRVLRLGLYFIY